MVITKEQFANVSRRVVFDYIAETCEKLRTPIILEMRMIINYSEMVINARKTLFGEDNGNIEKDLSEHEVINAIAEAAADEEKARPVHIVSPLLALAETMEQAIITARINEKLFEKKEESNGNREDN